MFFFIYLLQIYNLLHSLTSKSRSNVIKSPLNVFPLITTYNNRLHIILPSLRPKAVTSLQPIFTTTNSLSGKLRSRNFMFPRNKLMFLTTHFLSHCCSLFRFPSVKKSIRHDVFSELTVVIVINLHRR
jgi:hypothetical protein